MARGKSAPTVRDYWDERYRAGLGSTNLPSEKTRAWKWSLIEGRLGTPDDVIDVGCGDLTFWEGRDCPRYLGIDVSPSILASDRRKRPRWAFVAAGATARLRVRRRIVFCFDVLFHILDDADYAALLDDLAAYTGEWLFLFTWRKNPFASARARLRRAVPRGTGLSGTLVAHLRHPSRAVRALLRPADDTDGLYERYRPFEWGVARLEAAGLRLEAVHVCPYYRRVGAMYVFRRVPPAP